MLFGGVRKISKIEKMRFSSYFDACDESSSYLASLSYDALEKKHSSRKVIRWVHLYRVTYFSFRKEFVFVNQNVSKMVLIRSQKVEFESVLQSFALGSFVFDETWCVQVTSCKVYDYQIRRL